MSANRLRFCAPQFKLRLKASISPSETSQTRGRIEAFERWNWWSIAFAWVELRVQWSNTAVSSKYGDGIA
jgi:hypothetical protein